ncbi:unnamed protein product, partial [Durusdinium trenchii]
RRWDLVQSIAELTSHGFRSLRCSLATVAGKKSLREEVVVPGNPQSTGKSK